MAILTVVADFDHFESLKLDLDGIQVYEARLAVQTAQVYDGYMRVKIRA